MLLKLMKTAPVSVIIPCYNCAATIERAVASVCSQTLRPAELILIDDASSDNTGVILSLQREVHGDWVRIINLPVNGGAAIARNTGWEAATQPYIAFLDADDSWHLRKLEIQYNWMSSNPDAALSSHISVWIKPGRPLPEPPEELNVRRISKRELLLSNRFSTPSVMLKRDLPFRFDSEKRYAEDYLLWLRILLGGYSIYRLELPLAFIHKARFGEGGLSASLWKMEKEEMDNYNKLKAGGMITSFQCLGLKIYSILKYIRRRVIVKG